MDISIKNAPIQSDSIEIMRIKFVEQLGVNLV